MLEGLEAVEVNFSSTFRNKDFRTDSDFWTKEPQKNLELKYDKIGNLLKSSQYGISVSMNEDAEGYPIYRMNEIHNMMCDLDVDKHADISKEEFLKFKLNDRDVLFNRTNSYEWVGRTGLYRKVGQQDFTFASYLVRFIPDEQVVNPEYLTTYLNTKYGIWDVKRRSRQSINQTNVNPEEVKEIQIPILSKDIQNQIKTNFEKANSYRIKSIELYSSAETLLLETLGLSNFEPSAEPVNVKGFKESFLSTGRLDAEYYQKKYDEIELKIRSSKNGADLLSNQIEYITTGEYSETYENKGSELVPYIRNTNIGKGNIEVDEMFYVNPSNFKTNAKIGEILTSRVGTIGLFGVVKTQQENSVYSDNILAFKLKESFVPEVYALLFSTKFYQLLLEKLAGGSVQPLITQTSLKQLLIPFIDWQNQVEILTLVEESFHLKKQSEQLLETAKRAVELAIEQNEDAALRYIAEAQRASM